MTGPASNFLEGDGCFLRREVYWDRLLLEGGVLPPNLGGFFKELLFLRSCPDPNKSREFYAVVSIINKFQTIVSNIIEFK